GVNSQIFLQRLKSYCAFMFILIVGIFDLITGQAKFFKVLLSITKIMKITEQSISFKTRIVLKRPSLVVRRYRATADFNWLQWALIKYKSAQFSPLLIRYCR